MEKTTLDIIKEVADDLGYDYRVIKAAVDCTYEQVVNVTTKIDLTEVETEEEFDNLKTNIRIPGLGKVVTSYRIVNKINKQRKKYEEYRNKSSVRYDSDRNEEKSND